MTVFLDTGVIIAWIHKGDPFHERACAIMEDVLVGKLGTPIVLDHVIDETFTLLMTRVGRVEAARNLAAQLFGDGGPRWQLRATSIEDLKEASEVHLKHFERKLSLTDCVLAVHASQLRGTVATFDGGLRGVVPTIGTQ